MKKFAKISLAAAVAVAGLSSVASAKPLEEAIKGVDATGYVTYQYNDSSDSEADTNTQSNVYKAALTLSVPAADDVAVKVTGSVRAATRDADANPATTLENANFVYTGIQNLTVIAGKQALNTPWTEGSSVINATQNGTGALALYNAGFATLAAGHFVNNSIDSAGDDSTGATVTIKDNDISVLAAIVPMGEIATAQVWYAKIGSTDVAGENLEYGADALSVSLDVNLMDVAKLNVTHSTLQADDAATAAVSDNKQKLTKAVLSGAAGPVKLTAGYAKTGTDGGLVAFDSDASASFKGWDVTANGAVDAKAYLLSAAVDVAPNLNLSLTHVSADIKNGTSSADDVEAEETYAQVSYSFNKNLSAFLRYGVQENKLDGDKTLDTTKGRLQVGYKF
jgi:predicted porin